MTLGLNSYFNKSMNRFIFNLLLSVFILSSCKTQPDSVRRYADVDPNKVYKLHLNPAAGSKYEYNITNGSEFKMEVADQKVDNQNKSTVQLSYAIDKDSSGNFLLSIVYDKRHLN